MVRYSTDSRVNALFIQAECAGELEDVFYDLSMLDELDPEPVKDFVRESEPEPAPDAFLEMEYEDRVSGYEDYEPNPYDGTYSEM